MEEQFKGSVGLKGKFHVQLFDEKGNLKQDSIHENLITDYMDRHVAVRLTSTTDTVAAFMAVGSGTGVLATGSTLKNMINICALSGNALQGTGGDDNDVVYSAYWAAGAGTGSIREAGVFQCSGTSMLSGLLTYNDTISVNKGANDTLKIDWTVTCGSS